MLPCGCRGRAQGTSEAGAVEGGPWGCGGRATGACDAGDVEEGPWGPVRPGLWREGRGDLL